MLWSAKVADQNTVLRYTTLHKPAREAKFKVDILHLKQGETFISGEWIHNLYFVSKWNVENRLFTFTKRSVT